MSTPVGAPWPGASFGEVCSPAHTRAYLVRTAAALAGQSDKWARELARKGTVDAVVGRVPGRQGPPAYFLDAEKFEELGRHHGWWPPCEAAAALATLRDPAAQRLIEDRVGGLEREVVRLQELLEEVASERDALLRMVNELSRPRAAQDATARPGR